MAQSAVDQQDCGSGSPKPMSSAIWTSAQSVVHPSISTVRELDALAANSDAPMRFSSSSAREALCAASISWRSFFLARTSSSAQPLSLLALSRGRGGGMSEVAKRAANTMSSAGCTKTVDCILKSRHIRLNGLVGLALSTQRRPDAG